MPTLAHSNLPTPKSWDEFEDITLSAMQVRFSSSNLVRHGRQGQRQDGVDIYGDDDKNKFIGVQCKNTLDGLTVKLIGTEVSHAESFSPKITHLYIATTAKRDAQLQKHVREINVIRKGANNFTVGLLFWDDICSDLCGDDSKVFKHYPQFKGNKDNKKEADKALYDKFIKLLPSIGVIRFLDQNNMAGFSFRDEALDPLREFYYEWGSAEHCFLNSDLENIRLKLHEKSDKYLDIISSETWTNGGEPYIRYVPQEWEFEQPERFNKVVNALHELAGEIVKLHQSLVKQARLYFAS